MTDQLTFGAPGAPGRHGSALLRRISGRDQAASPAPPAALPQAA